MSKDKIEVSMNVYDIPIVVEALEKANKENERLHSIIKEVREYIENNWISKKDADIHRFDNEELEIEIGDIAVILEILDKVGEANE